jgi:NAD(P)-dependent dehydrogenase (short-subunit alcohol dehydrogenase family)
MAEMEKVVLITGAAHGLGRALTILFLEKGFRVVATDLDANSLAGLPVSDRCLPLLMDVTSDGSVKEAFAKVKEQHASIDLIISNAGIDRYFPLSEAPVERFRELFEVNLFGGYRVNQVFLPLLKSPGGRIVHISSESLNLTLPFMTYPLTKKAVEGYAKALRQELSFSGIDVVIVRPGAIRTRLIETVRGLKAEIGKWKLEKQFSRFAEGAAKEIGKTLSPEQVAEFVFKVSEKKNPPAVYRINNMLQLRIAAMLPFRITERIVRKRLI